jgi:DNA polymerase-3 subunit epsilon
VSAPLRERLASLFRGEDQSDPRCVAVDTETTGLDPQRDELLAIGAVAVDPLGVRVDDSFEVVVRPQVPVDNESVVVHGIGGESQRAGADPADALAAFVAYVADAPLVAFHAAFDRAVIERALAKARVAAPRMRWLDAAHLAATLFPEERKQGRESLDDWVEFFSIDASARHNAAGDAVTTALVFLRLRALAAADGRRSHARLARFSQGYRWL